MTDYQLELRGEIGDRFAAVFEGMRIEQRDGQHAPDRPRGRPGAAARRAGAHPGPRHRAGLHQPAPERTAVMSAPHARHHRPDPRLLGDAPQLGGLEGPLRGEGLQGHRPRLSRLRGRGRGAQRRPGADRAGDGAADHREARGHRRRARRAADPHGPLGGRRVHAGPARPRLRRRRRGDQLGAHRGRQARAAVAGQGDVPGAQEPRQPPPRRRLHARAVALRVHQRVQRGGVAPALRALPRPRLRLDLLGQRAGEHPPRQGRQLRQLQERRARAAAVHLRQRRTT